MPWEKSFDLDDAVDRATEVFWAKGYEPTSISDLVDGMGINKGSLYNAFGSKKELFKRVFQKYDHDHRQKALADLESIDDPVSAITSFFDSLIADSASDKDRKGCLLVNTALELPNHTDDVKEMVKKAFGEIESFFKRAITKGQKRGSIPKSVKAKETAKTLLSLVVGLRVLARGAFDPASLKVVKKDALRLLGKA